jgi:hypothetical protein
MIEKARRAFRAVRHAEYEEDQEEFASDVSRLARVLRRISWIYSSRAVKGEAKVWPNKTDEWAIELEEMALEVSSRELDFSLPTEPDDEPVLDEDPSTDEFDIGGLFAEL